MKHIQRVAQFHLQQIGGMLLPPIQQTWRIHIIQPIPLRHIRGMQPHQIQQIRRIPQLCLQQIGEIPLNGT